MTTVEQLQKRKEELEALIERFKPHFEDRTLMHEDHVARAFQAVTDGTLGYLNKKEKVTATYRRSLNSDIQLHRKISLRNLFFLKMRHRTVMTELESIYAELKVLDPQPEASDLVTEETPAA